MNFQKIGFIGLGLIGGSIAEKIKSNDPSTKLYASANRSSTVAEAYRAGLIENSEPLSPSDFSDCDLIFLCAPVESNLAYLRRLKPVIKENCCITDVGSTKSQIHEEVIRLGMEKNFIGGHPMTGSEKTGLANANERLLENAYYIITPTAATPESDIAQFRAFVSSLGSIPLILSYETHDYATAAISHLPHMIAFSLVNLVRQSDTADETLKTIAAGGFKDITRIASSSPVMWQNICSSNRRQLLLLMDRYMEMFQKLREDIAGDRTEALIDCFTAAKDYRDSFAVPGVRSADRCYELFVDLADETGGIATIAIILAFQQISIKNIGIIHNREFEDGVLRIAFYDEEALVHAQELLLRHSYVIHRR